MRPPKLEGEVHWQELGRAVVGSGTGSGGAGTDPEACLSPFLAGLSVL